MNAIVFGANGFIGSHVVTALVEANHRVTAVVRPTSDAARLTEQKIRVLRVDYNEDSQISAAMKGQEVVYNCTASASQLAQKDQDRVEVILTKKLVATALKTGVRQFIQLSSITIYGFEKEGVISEGDQPLINMPLQLIQQEREQIVRNAGKSTNLLTTIVRPASAIGKRGEHSFFAKFFKLNQIGKFPIIGKGQAKTSFIDTRDIGRAMTLIGEESLTGTYLVKGFDATWLELKLVMDEITGKQTAYQPITEKDQLRAYEYATFSITRIWDDSKIRAQGFHPHYSLQQAAKSEIQYLNSID